MHRLKSQLTAVGVLALLAVLTGQGARAIPQDRLSPTDVDGLVERAQTSEDHLTLAEYYRAESAQLEASAERHAAMGERYRTRKNLPPRIGPSWRGMARHCSDLAKSLRAAAKASAELAAEHERMAKQVDQ